MVRINTTGADDYAGGKGHIRMFVLGPKDIGKTRGPSYWPTPLYLDCEDGRDSLADRGVDYIRVRNSTDMREALDIVDNEDEVATRTGKPPKHQTLVVDTIDAYQRLVKDEWVRQNGGAAFAGHDAWQFNDARMQLLTSRLLNLRNFNVVINCHFKDKEMRDKETKESWTEFIPLLQGSIGDTIYNDFSLVGLMEEDAVVEEGKKVERRVIRFRKDAQWTILADRFGLFPHPIVVATKREGEDNYTFNEDYFTDLWTPIMARFESLPESQQGEEVHPEPAADVDGTGVKPPQPGGPVTPRTGASGTTTAPKADKPPEAVKPASQPAATEQPQPGAEASAEGATDQAAPAGDAETAPSTPVQDEGATEPAGAQPTEAEATEALDQATAVAEEGLGAEVVSEQTTADDGNVEQEQGQVPDGESCDICLGTMANTAEDFVGLSKLRHREVLIAAAKEHGKTVPTGPDGKEDPTGACEKCFPVLNEEKKTKSGRYAA